MNRVAVLLFIFLLVVFSSPTVLQAQQSVPVNGCFNSSLSGWGALEDGNWFVLTNNAVIWTPDGVNSCGAVRLGQAGNVGIVSHAFFPSSSSQLLFYARAAQADSNFAVKVFNYSTGQVDYLGNRSLTTSYAEYFYDLSPYAGSAISVFIYKWGFMYYWVSDVRVTNSYGNHIPSGYDINNRFTLPSSWVRLSNVEWSGQVGQDDYGSMRAVGSPAYFMSLPFCSGPYSQWLFWVWQNSGTPNVRARLVNFSGSSNFNFYDGSYSVTSWTSFPFNLSGYSGQCFALVLGSSSPSNQFYIDTVCPASGCTLPATLTPTLPTFPPWPTFPPYPTQMPYPTPYYGLGTPMPVQVVNTVVVTGSVRIDNLPGNGTPLPVYFPTRHITVPAVPPGSGQGGGMGVNAPQYIAQVDTRNNSGVLPLYNPGGSAPPLRRDGVVIREYSGGLCLPDQLDSVITGIDKCFNFNYMMISEWYVMGQNILPAFTVIFGVLTLFVIWKQIQKR